MSNYNQYNKNRKRKRGSLNHYVSQQKKSKTSDADIHPPVNITPQLDRGTKLEQCSGEITRYYTVNKQGEQEYRKKLQLVDLLYKALSARFPGCGLYLVGSTVNGFGEKTSDIDLCLMLTKNEVSWQLAVQVLSEIREILRGLTFIRRPKLIKANIPILDFYDTLSNRECDMNINNTSGIRNSHLLAAYCNFDARVGPLVLFIKKWAKFHNINSAKDCTISSYVLSLMVIHYLQCGVEGNPVLPCLQREYPQFFYGDIASLKMDFKPRQYPPHKQNRMSLGELMLGFFKYYATTFRFNCDVASVRVGRTLSIGEVRLTAPAQKNSRSQGPRKNTWSSYLLVEDPVDKTNAARAVFDANISMRIKHVFQTTFTTLNRTCDLQSIVSNPF